MIEGLIALIIFALIVALIRGSNCVLDTKSTFHRGAFSRMGSLCCDGYCCPSRPCACTTLDRGVSVA
jgi:hypothetical protein